MNNNYHIKAADWWASKIEEVNRGTSLRGLDSFKNELSKTIRMFVSYNASMIISTCEKKNNILENIALITGTNVFMPEGYEMRIHISNVYVYDKQGFLVASF